MITCITFTCAYPVNRTHLLSFLYGLYIHLHFCPLGTERTQIMFQLLDCLILERKKLNISHELFLHIQGCSTGTNPSKNKQRKKTRRKTRGMLKCWTCFILINIKLKFKRYSTILHDAQHKKIY